LKSGTQFLAGEDEIRDSNENETGGKEFALRSCIPSSITDTDQHLHAIAEKYSLF
jgi:hypothetical protein